MMVEAMPGLRQGVWTDSALRVLKERYLAPGETPEGMCWRVAWAIAQAERRWGKSEAEVRQIALQFYDLMVDHLFLPNSPTLMNAGKENGLQYSACYVLPVEDSLEGIFEAIKRAAIVHKSGGGTGFAFSRLRPKDSIVRSTGGKASGPVSFLRVFDAATEAVKQGGTRRGANMGILRVDHPDILEFITCKLDGGITNFNISVAITDRFMEALAKDEEYELIAPHTGEVTGRLRARDVWDKVVDAAWRTGDPGLVFIDRINRSRANPVPDLETIEATNPCGEQPLAPNDACNLGSINLAKFVRPGEWGEDPEGRIDWAGLERTVRLAVRFLDDVIEVNPYPLPEIDAEVKANRRIGLGVMGWADMLLLLGVPYDSPEAVQLAERVMGFIREIGHDESAKLAVERGPFPNWPYSIYRAGRPLRNATVTTIAPTGTISIIAGCSSGIEPLFAIAYSHIVGERHLTFVNPIFEEVARRRGIYRPEIMDRVIEQGTLEGIEAIPEDIRRVFVTAHEVDPEWHVRMQAAFQKHTDNGVSKTINLRHEATREDVSRAYMLAWELGCLGITVFRHGSKGEQVLHLGAKRVRAPEAPSAPAPQPQVVAVKPRPHVVQGRTYRQETPLGPAFITVNRNGSGEPFEVFINIGKAGSDVQAVAEAIGRLISLVLRLPSPMSPTERVREIVEQLKDIGGARQLGFGPTRVRSLPDAIAHILAEEVGGAQAPPVVLPELARSAPEAAGRPAAEGELLAGGKAADLCPECGQATLVYEEGCAKCLSCGYSEC